jgi:outer membrane lipoprotein-sorting protein
MRIPRRCAPVALTLVLSLTTSSCLWTHRVILRGGKRVVAGASPVLLTATRDGLEKRIANLYNAINSFQATVEMTPSVGSVYKGEINEGSGFMKDVRSYVLFRKPDWIRIIGKAPVVRTTEFDMVSEGDDFKVYLVSKNLFVVGANSAPSNAKNVLENLRPDHFLSAMLIRPTNPAVEIPILEDLTDEENALYVLHFMRKGSAGNYVLGRNVWFDRLNLSILRQKVFDESGEIVSDTRYSKWQAWSGEMFPAQIDINRPRDGYGVSMSILDMQMNAPLTEDKFDLPQPDGTQLRRIGEGQPAALPTAVKAPDVTKP